MTTRTLIFTIASVALLAACAQTADDAPVVAQDTSAADAVAVRDLTNSFVAAWNAGDMAAVSTTMAADVIHVPPGGDVVRGRDAVVQGMWEGVDITAVQQSATVKEVLMMGDYASSWGTWRIAPSRPPTQRPRSPAASGWCCIAATRLAPGRPGAGCGTRPADRRRRWPEVSESGGRGRPPPSTPRQSPQLATRRYMLRPMTWRMPRTSALNVA